MHYDVETTCDVQKFNNDTISLGENQLSKMEFYGFSGVFGGLLVESGKICKNNDHTYLFHCINTCRVPQEMFDHSA